MNFCIQNDGFCISNGEFNANIKVTGALPGEEYTCRVRAQNEHGWSEWSKVSLCTAKAGVPSAIPDATLGDATDRSLTLVWEPPDNDGGSDLTGYKVEMDKGDGRGMWPQGEKDSAKFVAEGLAPGTSYSFRVCALNREGSSQWTKVVEFSTAARRAEAPSNPPEIVNKCGRTSVNLRWGECPDPGGAEVLGYIVTVLRAGKAVPCGWKQVVETKGGMKSTEATVEGLNPGLQYTVAVQVRNAAGLGAAGAKLRFTSKADKPGAVVAPRLAPAGGKKPGGLRVDWGAAEAHGASIQSYTLEQAGPVPPGAGLTAPWQVVYEGKEQKYSASGLLPGGEYTYRANAKNAEGTGDWSAEAVVVIAAAVPGAPAPPVVTSSSAKSISVTWGSGPAHGCPVVGHQLQLRLASIDDKWRTVFNATSQSQSSFTIENQQGAAPILVPASEYELRVATVNEVGLGGYSSSSTTVTGATVPIAPTAPALELLKLTPRDNEFEHAVCVRWSAPVNTGGSAIVGYVVEMDDGAGGPFEEISWGASSLALVVEVVDLLPGREYKARVQAANVMGLGKFSSAGKVKTGWPAPAVAPVFAAVRDDRERADAEEEEAQSPRADEEDEAWCGVDNGGEAFALAWAQEPDFEADLLGGAPPLKFTVEMKETEGGDSWSNVYKGEDAVAMAPLASLEPFSKYSFRARAASAGGPSAWSEVLTLRTPAWQPSLPKLKKAEPDSLEVYWSRPPSVKISVLAMRDSGAPADDETAEPEDGEIRHVETGEIYQVVCEGGSKKAKVDRIHTPVDGMSKLVPETMYQFFLATPESEGGLQVSSNF